jgi:hypothetical protein
VTLQIVASRTDNPRVVIYDHNIFIIQATGVNVIKLFSFVTDDKAQCVRGFALGNPFQSGLRI